MYPAFLSWIQIEDGTVLFFSFFHSIQQFRIIRRNFLFYPSFSLGERANAQRESIGRKSRCQQTLNLNPFLSAERGSNRYRRSREPRIVNSSTPSPFSISRPSIPKNFIRYYSELHELLSPFRSSPSPFFLGPVSSLLFAPSPSPTSSPFSPLFTQIQVLRNSPSRTEYPGVFRRQVHKATVGKIPLLLPSFLPSSRPRFRDSLITLHTNAQLYTIIVIVLAYE